MINRNTDLIIIHDLMLDVRMVIVIGNNSTISTSKIIKITAIKKTRVEIGGREEFFWIKSTFEWESLFSVFINFP